ELSSETFPPELEPLPDDGSDTLTADKYRIETEPKKAEHPEINGVINITHNVSNALADHVAKLKRSSRYNVLLHQSWQQIGLANTDAVSIGVDTSEIENEDIEIFSTGHKPAKIDNKKLKSSIQGSIKLVLGRYLHIHTDLHYKRINKSYRPDSSALYNKKFDEFSIKSQRRMRSNELHYIDHPLLGILVIVSPIKQPELIKKNKELNEITPEMNLPSTTTTKKRP
ncbi:hypothetical protein KAR91_85070, partial [Candidatus Pacearchaeota archaeon]|nr:hypothetical protein [Candidatus Pacearchaeota archaeon]